MLLGRARLSRRTPFEATLRLVRKYRARGPGQPRRSHGRHYTAGVARKHYREPRLLTTSLGPDRTVADRTVGLYATRMQVEHTFRNDKSVRFGWQLDHSATRSIARLQMLLLIATLATLPV